MIDYVFDNEDESYHEEIFSSVVKNSEIPAILAKHGYNYEDILLDDSKWTLLERSAPELCADRVDYTLRDMYTYGYISLEEVHRFLEDIIAVEGKWSFKVSNGRVVYRNVLQRSNRFLYETNEYLRK